MLPDQKQLASPIRVPLAVQIVAWLAGVLACLAGMLNLIAEWDPLLATVQFIVLVIAPVVWMIEGRRRTVASTPTETRGDRRAILLAGLIGLTYCATCYLVGRGMVDLPPAYHDEYSYLFQARTLLSGRFSFPSHADLPSLFDQMHVLNEGRMASRYYPGTGLWLAPWVALRHPFWGQWVASSLTSIFVFWTGYEIGRLRVACIAGLSCALSPGIALFANLLLAHQATMVGLGFFVWQFVKWQRTRSPRNAFLAGCGLSFAMLCRPVSAAGIGFPFGAAFFYWLAVSQSANVSGRFRFHTLLAMGFPLVVGWSTMLAYHRDVTGSWTVSPYQLYTDIYTPRHVYGFDNVIRGMQKTGPKVIEAYDRWAVNLTPDLALTNLRDRWLSSWIWIFDILPLLISLIIVTGTANRWDRRWLPIGLAILSLHAIHIPYWYTGIMGWHYVFESAPLWCLLLGLASDLLCREWQASGRWLMPAWWFLLLLISVAGDYFPLRTLIGGNVGIPKVASAISVIKHPRLKYAEFDRWLDGRITDLPALVLIETDLDDQHMDYVVTLPDLSDQRLRARFRRGVTDLHAVLSSFPDRTVYLCDPKRKTIQRLDGSNQ